MAPIASKDPRVKTTIRNLRNREDIAKYLLNYDVNSAYYDPRSRAMREDPNALNPNKNCLFKGENAVRYTGDTAEFLKQEKFV